MTPLGLNADQLAIEAAYQDALKRLYGFLREGFTHAGGDLAQEQAPLQNFARGVALARQARDFAIPLFASAMDSSRMDPSRLNDDQKAIEAAYQDATKGLYGTLFEGYEESGGNPAQEQQANQIFRVGVALARQSRDRALTMVA